MSQVVFLPDLTVSYTQNGSNTGINRVISGLYSTTSWWTLLYHPEVRKIIQEACRLTSG